jgi:signal transduction histidine kinase
MSHILLLLDHKSNRKLLADWLGQHYQVLSPEQGTLPKTPVDLCMLDGAALARLWKDVHEYKTAAEPVFFPVVLVTSQHETELLTRHLWKTVDELIRTPIEKVELQARVAILLRTRQLSQELAGRNEDLETFFHALTHEARAPLRAITSFAHLLAEEEAGRMGEQGRQDLGYIASAAAQMQDLIEGLLAFARVERSQHQMQAVSLAHLVQACLHQLQPQIGQRQAQIIVGERLPEVQGNPTLLSLAVTNLLSNALKFLPPGGRPIMTIRVTTQGEFCRLEIADNGIGIPAQDQQRLFQPFVQLHGVEVYEGVGLGLATVRKAVELMGGRVGLTSTVGQGSTFWIELRRGA